MAIAMADLPLKDEPPPPSFLSRKQKRKLGKKEKRRQIRQSAANEARLEAERRLRDPVRIQEEAEALEKERIEREIQEKLWLEREEKAQEDAVKKRDEEERRRKEEEEEWIYVDDDGPSEIIWEGNEIIVRKKKIRVRRSEYQERNVSVKDGSIQDDRPVSNPLAPTNIFLNHERDVLNSLPSQATAFEEQKKLARSNHLASIEQTPNFGTEQDKTHCPFHIKTGVCRFGVSCSRVHVYPVKSCTLLIKNMYNGPGLPLDHDEGLEYTEEEIEQYYEEFYEDVHEEFLKYGELVSFKVCRNESSHLRGNVYVQFQSVDSAVEAYNGMNGRFYAGKQITCEFVVLTRWRAALCGEYMRSRHRVCSHGTACNFLHCFRNPRGEYEWADLDNHLTKPMKTAHGRRCDLEYTDQRSKYRYHTDRYASRNGRKRSSDHSDDHHISRKRRHADDHSETSSYENYRLKESEGSTKDRQRRHGERGTRYKDASSDNDSRERESRIERRYHKSHHRRKESRRYSKKRSIESDEMKSTYKDRNWGDQEHYPKMSPVGGDVGSADDTKQRCRDEKRKRRHRSKSTSSEDGLMDGTESMRKERRHHHHGSKRQGEHRKHDKNCVEKSSGKVSTRKSSRTKNGHEDNNDSDGRTTLKEKMQHETEKDWNHHIVDRYEPSYGSMD